MFSAMEDQRSSGRFSPIRCARLVLPLAATLQTYQCRLRRPEESPAVPAVADSARGAVPPPVPEGQLEPGPPGTGLIADAACPVATVYRRVHPMTRPDDCPSREQDAEDQDHRGVRMHLPQRLPGDEGHPDSHKEDDDQRRPSPVCLGPGVTLTDQPRSSPQDKLIPSSAPQPAGQGPDGPAACSRHGGDDQTKPAIHGGSVPSDSRPGTLAYSPTGRNSKVSAMESQWSADGVGLE